MKILFVSDIHGMKKNLPLIQEKYRECQCEKIVVLGDLYYANWVNKGREDYDPEFVRDFLESFGERLICLRGNCDSEEDIEYGRFPIQELTQVLENPTIYATHGHIYNENNWNKQNTILVFGHYHIPFIEEKEGNIFINPGSISLPKEGYKPSYMVWDEEKFTIYDVENAIIAEKEMKGVNH